MPESGVGEERPEMGCRCPVLNKLVHILSYLLHCLTLITVTDLATAPGNLDRVT